MEQAEGLERLRSDMVDYSRDSETANVTKTKIGEATVFCYVFSQTITYTETHYKKNLGRRPCDGLNNMQKNENAMVCFCSS